VEEYLKVTETTSGMLEFCPLSREKERQTLPATY